MYRNSLAYSIPLTSPFPMSNCSAAVPLELTLIVEDQKGEYLFVPVLDHESNVGALNTMPRNAFSLVLTLRGAVSDAGVLGGRRPGLRPLWSRGSVTGGGVKGAVV